MVGAVVPAAAFGYLLARLGALFNHLADSLQATPRLLEQPFANAVSPALERLTGDVLWTVGPFPHCWWPRQC